MIDYLTFETEREFSINDTIRSIKLISNNSFLAVTENNLFEINMVNGEIKQVLNYSHVI